VRYVRRPLEVLAVIAVLLLLLRYWPGKRPRIDGFEVLAHRGVHPGLIVVDRDTCTADLARSVEHPYLENTLDSIAAAFESGATRVEIDIHDTSDGHIVVFHDWTLDCKTNGTGVTREQPLAYLKSLDVGHGYSADGGITFPLRGTAIGAMPTLEEVLDRFPDRRFLLDHKSRSLTTVAVLANVLRKYPDERLRNLNYWGVRFEELRSLVPAIDTHVLARDDTTRCAADYAKTLGLGELPASCAGKTVMFPIWALKYVWGFPDRFMQKMIAAGSRLIVTEVDTYEDVARVIELPIHGVMTDRIEVVGPLLRMPR
jgi:glycerophosphoryl diester phosphodiesterase